MVYIPLFSFVQLGYPAITNIFVVNQIIRYNEVFDITNIFFDTVILDKNKDIGIFIVNE